ncbi:TIGR00300 family protein [Methanospirillum stamsii]|uniref:Ornithine cyclodeaminase n=1 Tax=Methanospirillum stamsii TaxID=1277351 RepID=A0A2V2NG00_9EURY|nr:TIGR00300 family protein [Methanospirillum stamsii]PWR75298.1 TIGR00300 family protein [Methanospirillum stamsii]
MNDSREIELDGHIIDSGIMEHVLDSILDMGGDFEILEFSVGKRKTDTSYARIRITGTGADNLDSIISTLHRHGARLVDSDDVKLVPAEGNRIVPKGFYSTTNYPTEIRINNEWIPVEQIEMDCLIVVSPDKQSARATPMSKLDKGSLVVIGEHGVKIHPPERSRSHEEFEFMGGSVSSERPTVTTIRKIAREILDTHKKGLKVALVGGPAIIHTGADAAAASMFHEGYIDILFAGNALATHDVEFNLYGTSLGMDIRTGELVSAGHKNHLYAISEIMRAGSIKRAVEIGVLNSGIMYECVKRNVPYVLAGSIRDDGPLPDVITDSMIAQDEMRRYVPEIGMVLMIATMLHSIAVGNCLPSYVMTVCVDINPSTLTKLMDRGTSQAIGVVSDAGAFFPMLLEQLHDLQKK